MYIAETRSRRAPVADNPVPPHRLIGVGVLDKEPLHPRRPEAFDKIRARALDPIAAVMAKRGEQSARIAALESRELSRRGSIIGTAITPARRQPKNAAMKSRPGREQQDGSVALLPPRVQAEGNRSRAFVKVGKRQ